MSGVVIVGGGQGGAQVAGSLREEGYAGPITVVGEEPGLPYGRPPLSKAYLTGKTDRTGLDLRAPAFYAERAIALVTGEATAIDRETQTLRVGDGTALPYDHLVLATGARNRPLPVPGVELEGVFQLRTVADADRLRARLPTLHRAVVIGAGFIGLEFAAVAAAAGITVTVLEATGRPMARALSEPMSRFFGEAHTRAGIDLVFGAIASRLHGEGGRVAAVETTDGRVFPAELVLVGIGVLPNVDLAAEAGLPIENGIAVDDHFRTADPAISAIGDCASYPQPFARNARMRLESVQNAVDGARCVAARLAGRPRPFRVVPWFWSDQGPYKLQIAGIAVAHDEAVLRGDPASGAFSVFCFEAGRLVGVESVNRPADHMIGRRLLADGTGLTAAEAADPATDLKAMTARPAARA